MSTKSMSMFVSSPVVHTVSELVKGSLSLNRRRVLKAVAGAALCAGFETVASKALNMAAL